MVRVHSGLPLNSLNLLSRLRQFLSRLLQLVNISQQFPNFCTASLSFRSGTDEAGVLLVPLWRSKNAYIALKEWIMKSRVICAVSLLIVVLSTSLDVRSYDFFGNDIAGLDVQNADQCAAACNGNANCQAWTFVKAGRLGPSARCFLKNPVPAPSFNSTCPSHNECISGLKRSDGWCGETPSRFLPGSQILGQGQVLSCPASQTCGPRVTRAPDHWCWFLFFPYRCHGEKLQTTDFFCQL
jgi:hypothetical protein